VHTLIKIIGYSVGYRITARGRRVKELTVSAPKWSTPCHRIRRSCAIPLDKRAIEVQQGGGKGARRKSRHSANASNVGRHFGWAPPTDHELGLNANNGLDVT
jgi:hypothetical protein